MQTYLTLHHRWDGGGVWVGWGGVLANLYKKLVPGSRIWATRVDKSSECEKYAFSPWTFGLFCF